MFLLAIYAHPDDEVFYSGGTLARYAAEGHRVYVLCATRGEAGGIIHPEIDVTKYPQGEALGKLREAELKDACAILGIEPPILLEYHDSGYGDVVSYNNLKALINQDIFKLEKEFLGVIKQLEPNIIITFDPHGGYGHLDHLAMHRAATAAFWSSGSFMSRPPLRLFYTARPVEEARKSNRLEPELYSLSANSFAARINISACAQKKRAAFLAHRSQIGTAEHFDNEVKQFWSISMREEIFALGGLRGGFPTMPVNDLFAGLREEVE